MGTVKQFLVALDGVDWAVVRHLTNAGGLPTFRRLLASGSSGPVPVEPPLLSPLMWTSVATGRYGEVHGVVAGEASCYGMGSACGSPFARRVAALWDFYSRAGLRSNIVCWPATVSEQVEGIFLGAAYASASTEEGAALTVGGTQPKENVLALLDGLRVRPQDLEPSILRLFIPGIECVHRLRDDRPERLLHLLADLYTRHNAAMILAQESEWDFMAVHYPFVAEVSRWFIDYACPASDVSERDRGLYASVLRMAYVLLDLLLKELIRAAGDDALVLLFSPHGIVRDRPCTKADEDCGALGQASDWGMGMVSVSGTGVVPRGAIRGARVVDVLPTLLAARGMALPQGAQGRVWDEVLTSQAVRIPEAEHEQLHKFVTNHSDAVAEARLSAEVVRKLFDKPGFVVREALAAFNIGVSLLFRRQEEAALPFIQKACFLHPEQRQYALHLARLLARLGMGEEALGVADGLSDDGIGGLDAALVIAECKGWDGDLEGALACLESWDESTAGAMWPYVLRMQAALLLLLLRHEEAERVLFRARSVVDDGSLKLMHASSLIALGRCEEAESLCHAVIADNPSDIVAHYTLARVLKARGVDDEADSVFAKVMELQPDFDSTHMNLCKEDQCRQTFDGAASFVSFPGWNFSGDVESRRKERRAQKSSRLRALSRERLERWEGVRASCRGLDASVNKEISVVVRSPFPDELARVVPLLPDARLIPLERMRVLCVGNGDAVRIVAASALALGKRMADGLTYGELNLGVKRRFATSAEAKAMVRELLDVAHSQGCVSVNTQCKTGAAEAVLLDRCGLEHVYSEGLWIVSLQAARDRLRSVEPYVRKAEACGMRVRSLEERDLPAVAEMAARHSLASLGRVADARVTHGLGDGYDGDLSFVMEMSGRIVGALLSRSARGTAFHVEIRMVAPEMMEKSGLVNALLMHDTAISGLAHGYESCTLTANIPRDMETSRMAKRLGGRILKELELWRFHIIEK